MRLDWKLFFALRWQVLIIVLPRLSLVAFNISRPFLVNQAINFTDTSRLCSQMMSDTGRLVPWLWCIWEQQ